MASTLFEEDVVHRTHRNKLQLGLVIRNHDWYSSVDESEDDEDERIKKGFVRVAWYPKGKENVLPEKKVSLYDRSVMPGDAVRRNQEGSQRGIVRSVNVSCHLQVVRTKQMIYNVCSQDLENILMYTPSCHVVMGSWIGVVRSIYVQLIVRLKNGARCALSDDSACRLVDIHDTDDEESVFSCDSFYPGQILRGPAMTFKNATWLSGQQPILSSKANFTVTVEEVNVVELDVHWQTRGLCRYPAGDCTDSNQLHPPPRKVKRDMLPCVRPLSYFIAASVQIGDKVMYRLRSKDQAYPKAVARGSEDCFIQPPQGEEDGESVAIEGSLLKVKPKEGQLRTADDREGSGGLGDWGSHGMNGELEAADVADADDLQDHLESVAKASTAQDEQSSVQQTSSSSSNHEQEHISDTAIAIAESDNLNIPEGGATGTTSEITDAASVQAEIAAQLKCLSDLQGSLILQEHRASDDLESDRKAKDSESSAVPAFREDLLATAEVLKVGLSRDVDLLEELLMELCDASESVSDIGKNFRTLLQRASDDSAREISSQVSSFMDSQRKLKQQIQMMEGLLADNKKSLEELDGIEAETKGAALAKPAASKTIRKARGQATAKSKNRRKFDDRDSNPSSGIDDDDDDDGKDSSDSSEDSDDTDSNASSKGENRRHKVVSSLLQRHTKKQHMRLVPKRRPPLKPLEAGERLCVEVTHTRTLVDVMWQDGTLEKGLVSTDLFPVHQLDELEFFPGDFVTKNNEELENVYGLVCKTDHKERTCLIQWIVRPNQQCNIPKATNTEEVSVYELTPHPDFTFNVGDVIVRIADSQHGIAAVKKKKTDLSRGSNDTITQKVDVSTQKVDVSTQMGDASTQMGETSTQGGKTSAPLGKTSTSEGNTSTSVGDASTQIIKKTPNGNHLSNASDMIQDNMDRQSRPENDIGTQMGENVGAPGTTVNSSSDHMRTTDTVVNDRDVGDSSTKTSSAKEGDNHRMIPNHSETKPQQGLEPASQRPCLEESQPPTSDRFPKESQPAKSSESDQLPVEGPSALMDQREELDSPDAAKAIVDRINQANLKAGCPGESGGGSTQLNNGSPLGIPLNLEETVPCAGQVRWIDTSGEIHVAWVDGSESDVLPQDLYKLEEDSDSDWSDNDREEGEWKDDHSEDDSSGSTSSSWETASDASKSADDANIISPPESQEKPSSTPASPGSDVASPEAKGPEDALHQGGSDWYSLEQTVSALSLVEDKMRQINSCTNSILQKRRGLSLLTPEEEETAGKGMPEALGASGEPDWNAAGSRNGPDDNIPITADDQRTSEVCSLPDTSTPSKSDSSHQDIDSKTQNDEGPSSASPASSKEVVATKSKEGNLGDGVKPKDSNHINQGARPKSPTKGSPQTESGQACDNFFLMEEVPKGHLFLNFLPEEPRQLSLTMRREMRLLQTSLPQGIKVKAFADRMDLFSVLFEGPSNTPYEDGLFFFDARLPADYPKSPPIMHYHAYCSGQLNPNLYNDGKVCVSLLGTWTGKGSEMWTSKSNLLQVLVSIQGLILVSEPYYNEAGYEKHRGSQPGKENSRLYNEMAVLKMVQSMTLMLTNPPDVFYDETVSFCKDHGYRMVRRIEHWLSICSNTSGGREPGTGDQGPSSPAFPLLPLSKGFILSMRQALRAYRAALSVAGVPDS